jgi:SAM-dependent methyltransferase
MSGNPGAAGARPGAEAKDATRRMWALGDYHRFATRTVWELGPALVRAWGIGPEHRVLDVAAGTGNVAIRAAEAGARVVASDLTPENFEAGRREASLRGVELEWVEADAEDLPFADGDFDVVTSAFGALFAPDHEAVAEEMLRVCRPGGVIGMANFRPEGLSAAFFGLVGKYAPPPPEGALPPLLWGDEDHVRGLFGERVDSLDLRSTSYVERSPGGPGEYRELFTSTFGPFVAIRGLLEEDPNRLAAFDEEFEELTERWNRGRPDGPAEYPYPYLLLTARKAAG